VKENAPCNFKRGEYKLLSINQAEIIISKKKDQAEIIPP
jgi:hypothetical protein